MAGSIYYPEIIVAAIDISGMKNLMKKNDNLNSATKIIGQLFGNIENNSQLKIHWKQFGDTAYLIADHKDSPYIQLKKITFSVASLIAFGMFAYEMNICDNFLLRSGISRGDLKAAQWNIGNSKGNYYIGNSIANAYKLEESQNWFGGCIDFDIDCSKMNSNFVIKYDKIPIKGKLLNKKVEGYSINWLEPVKQIINQNNLKIKLESNDIIKHIDTITKEIGCPKGEIKYINKKIKNTRKFVEHCLK